MPRASVGLVLCVAALGAAASGGETVDDRAEVVIRGVAIVDVVAGRLIPGQDIVVRGTRVERIAAAGGPLPAAKTTVAGRGKVALPGFLADGVRLAAFTPAAMQSLLAHGTTAVQDSGTAPGQLARWRRDLDSGRLYAPRLVESCTPPPAAAETAPTPAAPDAVHAELARRVAAGHRPIDALRAVTVDRARRWCRDGLGAIAAGAPADLVIVGGNPLDDVARSRDIDAVVFRGEVFTRAHLNMLAAGSLPLPTPPH
ncbi:MAG: hypothetical protein AB7U83_04475 [Vicinamibacterales bacterium]